MKSDLHCETAAALSKACEVILHAALNNLSALDHVSKSFHSGSKGKHENTSLFKPLIGIVSLLKQMMGSQTFLQVLADSRGYIELQAFVLNSSDSKVLNYQY